VGNADEEAGEVPKAFVVLKPVGTAPTTTADALMVGCRACGSAQAHPRSARQDPAPAVDAALMHYERRERCRFVVDR